MRKHVRTGQLDHHSEINLNLYFIIAFAKELVRFKQIYMIKVILIDRLTLSID